MQTSHLNGPQSGKRRIHRTAIVVLAACIFAAAGLERLGPGRVAYSQSSTAASLRISNVWANATTVGRYEKFELTFDIAGTVATHLDWPYDPNPPPGLPARAGITVDGLFSPDNWTTVYTQPAFLYQPYTYTVRGQEFDHLYPSGAPVWKIRFAPPAAGVWRYRIRATDGSGTVLYPASGDVPFTVTTSDNPGFLRVSQTDPRYFEFSDGTLFIGVGHNEGFDRARMVQEATAKFSKFATQRANFMRVWMSSSSVFGSAWWPWSSHHLSYDGYLPATSLTTEEAYADGDVAMKIYGDNPCMHQGSRYPISVLPGKVYRVRARIKAVNVGGPSQAGKPYGFVVKVGDWLGQDCASPNTGTLVTSYVADTGGAWQIITGSLTTAANQYFLGNLYLALVNTTRGAVYVDEVWLEEKTGPDSYGPNVLPKPKVNVHTYFDPVRSWQWDRVLDEATARGVYLKLVVLEKNDWIFNRITPSGAMTTTANNNNFYAVPGTKVRWLHQAWWRYLTARWGYSTAVHSWELLNEGDPYNAYHYDQAQAFARYIHEHDPNRHMVTTSLWHSFPMAEFWANPAYSDLDYADLHAYISTGWGRYAVIPDQPPPPLTYTNRRDCDGSGWSVTLNGADRAHSANLWGIGIRGDGEWLLRYRLRLEGWSGSCEQGNTLSGPRLIWWMGERSNVVPPRADGVDWRCSTPITPTDWVTYDSAHVAGGASAPLQARIFITDGLPHHLTIGVQNRYGTGGVAYVDAVELVAPDGTALAINGQFALDSMPDDAALYTAAYSLLEGGRSPAGAGMPLVRGEAGLDHPGGPQEELDDLAKDSEGVWLHNLIWGGINPGGMYDLYYWADNIRYHDLYDHYKHYQDFLDGIPLNNGAYRDAEATVSHPDLRAWGQKDVVHRQAHLWIQNRRHTWRNVVDGVSIPALSGRITIPGMPPGAYRVEWWNTITGAIVKTEVVEATSNGLVLNLPVLLNDDIAAKVSWAGPLLGLSKTVNRSTARPGDVLTYTLVVANAGMTGVTCTLTDAIPTGTAYVSHSASVTPLTGNLDDSAGIRWTGELGSGKRVTVTFAVRVGPREGPLAVFNVAAIEAGSERIERRALTIVNARQVHLPLALKGG